MDRISNNFISSLRNDKTPTKSNQKSNQKLKNTPRTPTSASGKSQLRRNTVSNNYLSSSHPQKSTLNRQSLQQIISSRNIPPYLNTHNPFFNSERKSVDTNENEQRNKINQNLYTFEGSAEQRSNLMEVSPKLRIQKQLSQENQLGINNWIPSALNLSNIQPKGNLFHLQDSSSLHFFQQGSQRQSNGSKLFSRQNSVDTLPSSQQMSVCSSSNVIGTAAECQEGKQEFFRNSNLSKGIQNSKPSQRITNDQPIVQNVASMNSISNPKWRDMRNRYKQQKAKSIDDHNRQSLLYEQQSALDKIQEDNDKMRGNQKKTQNESRLPSVQLPLSSRSSDRYSLDSLRTQPQDNPIADNNQYEASPEQNQMEVMNQSVGNKVNKEIRKHESEKNGKGQANSLLNIGFLEEQVSPKNEANNRFNVVSSQPAPEQFVCDNSTYNQSKEIHSDLFASSCNDEQQHSISINKGLAQSGFSDISPIQSQLYLNGKSSTSNNDHSSRKGDFESRKIQRDFRTVEQHQTPYSDSSDDNYIQSLQTPDQAKNSTILQMHRFTTNPNPTLAQPAAYAERVSTSSIVGKMNQSFEQCLINKEIESPEIQNKLKQFLEEMGYYKDTTKTKQINKIMAEITLGLVIEKAKSPQNSGSENEGISHEKIEEYHFDILKKQVEVLHSLCKGEDEVETEVGKKIVNDVLCAKFGKKCIQDAFKNAVKRSRSMKLQPRASLNKLSTSCEASKNSTVIHEKEDEEVEQKDFKANSNESDEQQPLSQKSSKGLSPQKQIEPILPTPKSQVGSKVDGGKQKIVRGVARKRAFPMRTLTSESQKELDSKVVNESDTESATSVESNSNFIKGTIQTKKGNKKLKK